MPDLNLPNLVYDKMPTPTLSGAILSDISGSQFATVLTGSAIVRPTDTTAYTLGDLVANSTAFASVTPVSFANAASSAAGVGKIGRLLFKKSGTNVTNAQFRVHFFSTNPVPTSGDNTALATPIVGYAGAFDVTVDRVFTDGSIGIGLPIVGSEVMYKLSSGTTLYALVEARAAYTPVSGETYTIYVDTYRF